MAVRILQRDTRRVSEAFDFPPFTRLASKGKNNLSYQTPRIGLFVDKRFCHVEQDCLLCEANLFHITINKFYVNMNMNIFAPRTMSAVSATNMMYDLVY